MFSRRLFRSTKDDHKRGLGVLMQLRENPKYSEKFGEFSKKIT